MKTIFAFGGKDKVVRVLLTLGLAFSGVAQATAQEAGLVAAGATQAATQEVRISPDIMQLEYNFAGKTYIIRRNQDQNARIPEAYSKTSRPCPIFCIQPITPHEGVQTYGELELVKFMQDYVSEGKGFLIDSRTKDWYAKGTIPGAVNLPYNVFVPSEGNVFFDSVMNMLGGTKSEFDEWSFEDPKDLLLFCNGPWCAQSPTAIRNLIAINYPVEKLHYYRGGMQNWVGMGFVTEIPK